MLLLMGHCGTSLYWVSTFPGLLHLLKAIHHNCCCYEGYSFIPLTRFVGRLGRVMKAPKAEVRCVEMLLASVPHLLNYFCDRIYDILCAIWQQRPWIQK